MLFSSLGGASAVRYLIFQLEEGSIKGTPHYQGFIQLDKQCKLRSLQNKLKRCMYINYSINPEAAIEYCQKSEGRVAGPWEHGTFIKKGARVDLSRVVSLVHEGASLKTVAANCSEQFIKYHRGIEALIKIVDDRKRSWMTNLHIYWGVSGSGKSHTAHVEAGRDAFYLPVPSKLTDKIWWNGYTGQSSIIIEDFYGTIDLPYMLKLCDKYPMQVEVKGGMVEMLARDVYITSNKPWKDWYGTAFYNCPEWEKAFERRVTSNTHFVNAYNAPVEVEELPDIPLPLTRQNAMLDWTTYLGDPTVIE